MYVPEKEGYSLVVYLCDNKIINKIIIPASYDLSGQSGFSRIWNGRHRGLISSENLSIGFFNFTSAMSGVCWYFWIKDS